MTFGIILIQMIEKRYIVDILIYKTILPNVDNKLIKANFKDLISFRITINFILMFEINMHYEIKVTWYKVHFSAFHSDSMFMSTFICMPCSADFTCKF